MRSNSLPPPPAMFPLDSLVPTAFGVVGDGAENKWDRPRIAVAFSLPSAEDGVGVEAFLFGRPGVLVADPAAPLQMLMGSAAALQGACACRRRSMMSK